jgi:hypothetical protein
MRSCSRTKKHILTDRLSKRRRRVRFTRSLTITRTPRAVCEIRWDREGYFFLWVG